MPTLSPTPAPAGCREDVSRDGRVDVRDLIGVARHIGKRYNARYDVNGDGKVNVFDLIVVAQQFGKRC
jgi:hypothetical protein